jgi:hypothetical protein
MAISSTRTSARLDARLTRQSSAAAELPAKVGVQPLASCLVSHAPAAREGLTRRYGNAHPSGHATTLGI